MKYFSCFCVFLSVIEQDIEQEEQKTQISADLRIRKTQVCATISFVQFFGKNAEILSIENARLSSFSPIDLMGHKDASTSVCVPLYAICTLQTLWAYSVCSLLVCVPHLGHI